MYIKKIKISNFRNIDENGIELIFNKGFNAIIGENNTGKSAVISAIRIACSILQYKKDIYFSKSDFHINAKGEQSKKAEIDIYFSDVPKALIELWKENDEGEIHLRFEQQYVNGVNKIRHTIWSQVEGNPINADTLDAINIVYLGALRDAENEMRPSKNSKIASLLNSLTLEPSKKEELLQELRNANSSLLAKDSITQLKEIINKNLLGIEKDILHQEIGIGFLEPKFDSIAASLRPWIVPRWYQIDDSMPMYSQIKSKQKDYPQLFILHEKDFYLDINGYVKQNPNISTEEKTFLSSLQSHTFDLYQNGLGYNNILFMSAVLGDMKYPVIGTECNLLLAEEPEAHLHPQLQSLIYQFFNEQIKDNEKLQIICTTHSPTLVSKIEINSINVLFERNNSYDSYALCLSGLDKGDVLHLQKYLDVTKSQLFFSKGSIFVEGISEAILLPLFAILINRDLITNAIEIVNVDSTSFAPFVKVVKNTKTGNPFIKSVVLTDNDCCTNKKDEDYISLDIDFDCSHEILTTIKQKLNAGTPSNRCLRIQELCKTHNVACFTAQKTLEYELALPEGNIPIILRAIKKIHPTTGKELEDLIAKEQDSQFKSIRIWLFIQARHKDKALFSQTLCDEILSIENEEEKFIVPEYIKNAIEFVAQEVS